MSDRNLPPYPLGGDWKAWATQLVEFLSRPGRSEEDVVPRTVSLSHQIPGEVYRAVDSGLLMYDPAQDAPVISIGGVWEPFRVGGNLGDQNMVWKGNWINTSYEAGDVVLDAPWLMIANKDTTDRPAPQNVGPETPVYTGASPTGQITAKTLGVGNRYTFPFTMKLVAYRIYTIAGNDYSVFYADVATGQITQLFSGTAQDTGWQEFRVAGNLVASGTQFELVVVVTEPDPTPTVFTLSYNYTKPNNNGVPATGDILHSNREAGLFNVNKTDQNGDQSAQLATLTVGDVIEGAGVRWSIQSIIDNGTWYEFGVAPASQGSPTGVQNFNFETVTATPITTVIDTNYYLGNPAVSPFFAIDGGARTNTDDGYGIDITLQEVSISPDWDFMSTYESVGGGGTAGPYFEEDHTLGYRIVGTTLEMWGVNDQSVSRTITFPKSFANTGYAFNATDQRSSLAVGSTPRAYSVDLDAKNVGSIRGFLWNTSNGNEATASIMWHAIGEWDGV